MKPYSLDLRERVLADCDAGMPTKQVAQKYRVSDGEAAQAVGGNVWMDEQRPRSWLPGAWPAGPWVGTDTQPVT